MRGMLDTRHARFDDGGERELPQLTRNRNRSISSDTCWQFEHPKFAPGTPRDRDIQDSARQETADHFYSQVCSHTDEPGSQIPVL